MAIVEQNAERSATVKSLLDRGLVRYATGRQAEAIELWRQAFELDSENSRAIDYLETAGAIPPSINEGSDGFEPDVTASIAALPTDSSEAVDPPLAIDVPTSQTGGETVSDVEMLAERAKALEEEGAYELALGAVEELLKRQPANESAFGASTRLKEKLIRRYLEALEPFDRIVRQKAQEASLLELSLDPIGGFIVSQIDGRITLEELLSIMGTFDRYRVMSTLHFLVEKEVVELVEEV